MTVISLLSIFVHWDQIQLASSHHRNLCQFQTHFFAITAQHKVHWLALHIYCELKKCLPKQSPPHPFHKVWNSPQTSISCTSRSYGNSASLYKPLRLWTRPLSHRQITFCLFPKSWFQIPLAIGARILQQLQSTYPSTFDLCVIVDKFCTCPIWTSSESVMAILT